LHTWRRWEMHTKCFLENLNGRTYIWLGDNINKNG
jgi:hypothetical protein